MYNANGLIQGWQCPVCGRVLSPFTAECPCYREQQTPLNATTTAPRADTSATIVSLCDHNWMFGGPVTEGTRYYCSKCGATKTEPFGGII